VPARERQVILDGYDYIFFEAWIEPAEFYILGLDQEPNLNRVLPNFELKPDIHAPIGEKIAPHKAVTPRPQHHVGIGVLGRNLFPPFRPVTHCYQHSP
jgi:hypothetical protein